MTALLALGVAVPLWSARPATAGPDDAIVLVDGHGAVVGPVAIDDADPSLLWVGYAIGDVAVRLLFGENGIRDTGPRVPLLYEHAECDSPALLAVPAEDDAPRDAAIAAHIVYWPRGTGTERTIRAVAWPVRDPAECPTTLAASLLCCAPLDTPERFHATRAADTTLTSLQLHTPFRLASGR